MEKRIYLVRHGDYDQISGQLNSKGIEQIQQTGNRIKQEINDWEESDDWEMITYTSPITRAAQSAEILARILRPSKWWINCFNRSVYHIDDLACEKYGIGKVVKNIETCGVIVSHLPDIKEYLKGRKVSKGEYVVVKIEQ